MRRVPTAKSATIHRIRPPPECHLIIQTLLLTCTVVAHRLSDCRMNSAAGWPTESLAKIVTNAGDGPECCVCRRERHLRAYDRNTRSEFWQLRCSKQVRPWRKTSRWPHSRPTSASSNFSSFFLFLSFSYSEIPAGKVSTYGGVALAINSCARAVGGALRVRFFC